MTERADCLILGGGVIGLTLALELRARGRDVTVTYTNGWTEIVQRGRYKLTDRYGHVAVDRTAISSASQPPSEFPTRWTLSASSESRNSR